MARMTRPKAAPLLIGALLLAGLASWFVSLAVLRHSYFGTFTATGTIATLADAVMRGQAPGHDDGTIFLGTYYFPPFPLLVAGGRALGFDWLCALRAATVASGLFLLFACGWAAHALGGGRRGALLAPALVLATYTFKGAGIDGRADVLAAGFALAALAASCRADPLRGWASPVFAAASFLTKATSVAVPVALALWALRHRRAAALPGYGLRFLAAAAVGVLATAPVHGPGWYASAAHALITAPLGRSSILRGPTELVRYLGVCGELAVFASLAVALLAGRRGRGGPAAFYGAVTLLLAAGIMCNYGSASNHLVELGAAAATFAAAWAAPRLSRRSLLPAAAVAIAVTGATWRDLAPVLRHASAPGNVRAQVIEAVRRESGEVFTEDALLTLAAGRRPAVSDAGALRSLAQRRDPRALRTIDDIAGQRFALVVLEESLEATAAWYRVIRYHDPTLAPLEAHYVEVGTLDGFHLYRPRME